VATYFDATADSADIAAYLPEKYVANRPTNLTVVASEAEADVIGRYTAVLAPGRLQDLPTDAVTTQTGRTYTSLGDGTAVFLRGYTEDAADCEDAALRRGDEAGDRIAIVWKIGQELRDVGGERAVDHRQGIAPVAGRARRAAPEARRTLPRAVGHARAVLGDLAECSTSPSRSTSRARWPRSTTSRAGPAT
jgi:hypothetical protein